MNAALKRQVRERANETCEYCRMPQRFYRSPFQIDHVIVEQHGGQGTFENLAFACYHCNLMKGPNIAGRDLVTHRVTRLFNPRRDQWRDHFQWRGARIVGRVTITVLDMNHPAYVLVRESHFAADLLK